jgi:hypothetical protein
MLNVSHAGGVAPSWWAKVVARPAVPSRSVVVGGVDRIGSSFPRNASFGFAPNQPSVRQESRQAVCRSPTL